MKRRVFRSAGVTRMYPDSNMENFLLQVSDYLKQQYEKMLELESEIRRLKKELDELKGRPLYTIEKMEYRFDQLKIETLTGTLNIGISPEQLDGLKELSVGNKIPPNPHPDWDEEKERRFREAKERLDQFCKEELHGIIIRLAKEMGQKMDPFAVSFIAGDLKNQVDERLRHYILTYPELGNDALVAKTKEDLIQAVRDFITILPKMEE